RRTGGDGRPGRRGGVRRFARSLPDFQGLPGVPSVRRHRIEETGLGNPGPLVEIICHPAWGAALKPDDVALLKGLLEVQPAAARNQPSTELDLTVIEQAQDAAPAVASPPSQPGIPIHIHDGLPPQVRDLDEVMPAELLNIRVSANDIASRLRAGDPAAGRALQDLTQALQLYGEAAASVELKSLEQIAALARLNLL